MTDAAIAVAGPDQRAAFRPATFADALRSEWTKLRSVRSTFWALTVTVVLGIGLGAAISAAAAHGITLFELIPVRASLEEAFMELTRDSVEYQAAGATR